MSNIHILQTGSLTPEANAKLEQAFTVYRYDLAEDGERLLAEVGPKIQGIVAAISKSKISPEFMAHFPNLKIISGFGVGYDHIDAVHAASRGIYVTHTPGVLDAEVADTTFALLLATIREVRQADRFVRSGDWLKNSFHLTASLRGRKVGIIGLGRIGKTIAKRLEAFDLPVAYYGRRKQEDVPYEYHANVRDLAAAVDVLIAIVPGGKETFHMINADVLKALGPNGVLINMARGTVVDEAALIEALQNKTILAAGLDVFEREPVVPQALIDLDNVVLLPHVGSATVYTRNEMAVLVFRNMEAFFAGKPPLTPVPETPWRA